MGRYIGIPHSSQTQRRPIDRPARTKRVKLRSYSTVPPILSPDCVNYLKSACHDFFSLKLINKKYLGSTYTIILLIDIVVRIIVTVRTMEPHCCCYLRAFSYSLLDGNVIFLFVLDVFPRTAVTTAVRNRFTITYCVTHAWKRDKPCNGSCKTIRRSYCIHFSQSQNSRDK